MLRALGRLFGLNALRSITSYAHSGEDIVISRLAKLKKRGFYVDIGCSHPVNFSNTYYLYKRYHWRGLNIDADPQHLPLFKTYRPHDTTIHAGVGPASASAEFYIIKEDRSLNTFVPEVAAQLAEAGKTVTQITLPIHPLAELFDMHQVGEIDAMNVDVEGYDLAVLQSNDWSRWRPAIIAVEDHAISLDDPSSSATYTYLRQQGYAFHSKCNYTSIYVRQ